MVRFYAGDRVLEGYSMGLAYQLPAIGILVWGISLGLAALAYRRRNRPPCGHREGGGPVTGPPPAMQPGSAGQPIRRLSGGPR